MNTSDRAREKLLSLRNELRYQDHKLLTEGQIEAVVTNIRRRSRRVDLILLVIGGPLFMLFSWYHRRHIERILREVESMLKSEKRLT